jgi:pyruvate dehydrogenase E2 component (dihydrolipoamide acetyltransferase)
VRAADIALAAEKVARRQPIGRSLERLATAASPLARKTAAQLNVDIERIEGSGPRGKVYRADVLAAAAAADAAVHALILPSAAKDAERPSRLIPFDSMRKAIASRMVASKFSAPHLYFFADVNMDKVLAFKEALAAASPGDVHVSVNDVFIKLTALVLRNYPNLNATVEGDAIRLWEPINIGLAVALADGLIVPAIPQADRLRFQEIAGLREELVEKAHSGKLSPDEMNRGTFTISSLAKSRITHFTAIINPPQTAILSVGPAQERPIADGGELKVGRLATLGLSVDHRVIDGKVAADFLSELTEFLENAQSRLISYY